MARLPHRSAIARCGGRRLSGRDLLHQPHCDAVVPDVQVLADIQARDLDAASADDGQDVAAVILGGWIACAMGTAAGVVQPSVVVAWLLSIATSCATASQ